MRLPPPDHPIYKILQSSISVVGLSILAVHGFDHGHTSGVDASDVSGVVGGGLAAKLGYGFLRDWMNT